MIQQGSEIHHEATKTMRVFDCDIHLPFLSEEHNRREQQVATQKTLLPSISLEGGGRDAIANAAEAPPMPTAPPESRAKLGCLRSALAITMPSPIVV